jgi:hypothetical protein
MKLGAKRSGRKKTSCQGVCIKRPAKRHACLKRLHKSSRMVDHCRSQLKPSLIRLEEVRDQAGPAGLM